MSNFEWGKPRTQTVTQKPPLVFRIGARSLHMLSATKPILLSGEGKACWKPKLVLESVVFPVSEFDAISPYLSREGLLSSHIAPVPVASEVAGEEGSFIAGRALLCRHGPLLQFHEQKPKHVEKSFGDFYVASHISFYLAPAAAGQKLLTPEGSDDA